MNKGLLAALVFLFAGACLGMTALMPAAELGYLNPAYGQDAAQQALAALEPARQAVADLARHLQDDPNFQYYIYALFLGLAMTAAAVAINLVGREEAEEKTVLPLKK